MKTGRISSNEKEGVDTTRLRAEILAYQCGGIHRTFHDVRLVSSVARQMALRMGEVAKDEGRLP